MPEGLALAFDFHLRNLCGSQGCDFRFFHIGLVSKCFLKIEEEHKYYRHESNKEYDVQPTFVRDFPYADVFLESFDPFESDVEPDK